MQVAPAPAPAAGGPGAAAVVPGGTAPGAPSDAPPASDSPEKKRVVGKGADPFLLKAVVQPYVDDTDLYVPKITRKQRFRYWEKMNEQKVRRNRPRIISRTRTRLQQETQKTPSSPCVLSSF